MKNKDFTSIINAQQLELDRYFTELKSRLSYNKQFFESVRAFIDLTKDTYTLNKNHSRAIYFTGIGKNDTIAKKTANMFRSLNFNAHHISPVDAMHGDMGLLNDNDILVSISKSGNTSELIHFLEYVNKFRTLETFAIQIGSKNSKFKDTNDHVFQLPEVQEIDSWNLVPTTSNIATQLFLDMIAILTSNELRLTREEFIESHPGGAIGAS
jgi:arabinose-5-phosphate isomerase